MNNAKYTFICINLQECFYPPAEARGIIRRFPSFVRHKLTLFTSPFLVFSIYTNVKFGHDYAHDN